MPLEQTRFARSLTLTSPIRPTARSPYQRQDRTSLGQGESWYLYGEYGPAVIPPGILFPEPLPPIEETVPPPILDEGVYLTQAGEATPPGQVLLRRGDRGDQVRNLQTLLRRLGYAVGTVDGIFGPVTEQAVRAFQRDAGLSQTGQVDGDTWATLQSSVPAAATLPLPTPQPAPAPAPAETPSGEATPVPEVLREREAGRPPERAPETTGPKQEVLGLPVGMWVALGVLVVVMFATTTPAPGGAPRPPPGPAPRPAPAK